MPTTRKPSSNSAYWEAMIKAVSIDEWAKITRKAVEQAIDGDNNARKFLADTLLKHGPSEPTDLEAFWKAIIEKARQDDPPPK